MLRCNHCGELIHADSETCENCGMSLSGRSRGGNISGMSASEQPELPTWLESLHAGMRPATSGAFNSEQPDFSNNDLMDEGVLPSWMRPENADNLASGPHPAWRPVSMPAPNTDGEYLPPQGISVSSLIDEQSLPSWMTGNRNAFQQAMPDNLSAASLVQPNALPDWIKNVQPPQQPTSSAPAEPIQPIQRISASDLFDQQALPSWMSGQPVQSAQPGPYNSPPANGQSGLAGSSLLDMNSLPDWLRQGEQMQNRPDFEPPAGGLPPASPRVMPPSNGNLSAASLIDMNSLPGWLRSESQQSSMGPLPQAQGFPGGVSKPGSFSPPPRVENMRVPSRPRGEVGPQEQSEMAANVFSSMLGVTSAAPYYPAQPSGNAFGSPQNPRDSNFQEGSAVGWSGADFNNSPNPQQGRINQAPIQPGYGSSPSIPGGYSGGYSNSGNNPTGSAPNNSPGFPPAQEMDAKNSPGFRQPASKPARRSFIEIIRDWFSR